MENVMSKLVDWLKLMIVAFSLNVAARMMQTREDEPCMVEDSALCVMPSKKEDRTEDKSCQLKLHQALKRTSEQA